MGRAEVTLVSLVDKEMVPKAQMPSNTSKYRQWVTVNGQRVEALRDTGVRKTDRCHLVSSEQVIPNSFHQVVGTDNCGSHYPVDLVLFEWGGGSLVF